MNLYEKLATARVALHEKGLKKSGKNDFAKYDYFELSDFIPEIVKQEGLLKFCCIVSFADVATLTIVDAEKPDSQIVFASPMSTAELKGMHAVQNLGAVQTYIRRYLYTNAFEITENDVIDKTASKPKPETKQTDGHIDSQQLNVLKRECVGLDGKPDQVQIAKLKDIYTRYGYKKAEEIKPEDYENIRREFVDSALPFDTGTNND